MNDVPQPFELDFIVDDIIVQGIEDAIQKYNAEVSGANFMGAFFCFVLVFWSAVCLFALCLFLFVSYVLFSLYTAKSCL